jgi:hypothetical protein
VNHAERWHAARTIDEYVGQMWRKNRTRFTRNRDGTLVDDTARALFSGRPFRALVLTEHYCEDSLQLVPVLWRLTEELPNVELRVLRQHEHPDLASRYLTPAGYPAIPVFIVLDERLSELGALIERPARMTAELTAEARRFQQAHPELLGINRTLDRMPDETRDALKRHIAAWRVGQHDRWAEFLLEDLAAMVAAR